MPWLLSSTGYLSKVSPLSRFWYQAKSPSLVEPFSRYATSPEANALAVLAVAVPLPVLPLLLLPMSARGEEFGALLQAARPGTLVLAGRPDAALRAQAAALGLPLLDYNAQPALARLNAVPTAEGCLSLLLRWRDRTIWESPFLVLGYGRVGQAVEIGRAHV